VAGAAAFASAKHLAFVKNCQEIDDTYEAMVMARSQPLSPIGLLTARLTLSHIEVHFPRNRTPTAPSSDRMTSFARL